MPTMPRIGHENYSLNYMQRNTLQQIREGGVEAKEYSQGVLIWLALNCLVDIISVSDEPRVIITRKGVRVLDEEGKVSEG